MRIDNQYWLRQKYNKLKSIKPIKKMGDSLFHEDEKENDYTDQKDTFKQALEHYLDDQIV